MIQHTKIPVTEFVPGETYKFSMNSIDLYSATVTKFHGGCWATVRVESCLYEPMSAHYQPGTELDIKVAMYEVTQLPQQV